MSKSKKMMKDFMPLMAAWESFGDVDACRKQWKDFRSTMDTFWDQMAEMQRTSVETWKDQWNKAFPQMMEMEDNFTASLPEELPTLPGMPACPVKPKAVMDKVKEFQEMANKHAMEQVDSRLDFMKQTQQQAKTAVIEAVDSIEEKVDEKLDKKAEDSAEASSNE